MVGGDPLTIGDFDSVFENILSYALGVAAIILFIVIVINGFKFISAGEDPRKLEGARTALTTAVIGFVLVALAFLILVVIGNFALTNTDNFLNFTIFQGN